MKEQAELHWLGPEPQGSGRKVYLDILQGLDEGRMVPGQRLVETELAATHEVGRNAVREALQHLAVRGVVDLRPNRSPAIRRLDLAESLEVMDVAEALTRLVVRAAAAGYRDAQAPLLDGALAEVAGPFPNAAAFGRARRHFYRALLIIGGNRELQRLFPAVGMHIIHAQYPSQALLEMRQRDYRAIADAVRRSDPDAAERAAATHVAEVRKAILGFAAAR